MRIIVFKILHFKCFSYYIFIDIPNRFHSFVNGRIVNALCTLHKSFDFMKHVFRNILFAKSCNEWGNCWGVRAEMENPFHVVGISNVHCISSRWNDFIPHMKNSFIEEIVDTVILIRRNIQIDWDSHLFRVYSRTNVPSCSGRDNDMNGVVWLIRDVNVDIMSNLLKQWVHKKIKT